jgi:hypothetical protein
MLNPFLSADQQAIVVFHLWRSLAYWKRLGLSLGCILFGILLQWVWPSVFWLGLPFLLAGNLFLVVGGYDNRISFGKYAPEAEWEPVDEDKLAEVEHLVTQMRRWDRSLCDVTNRLGMVTFVLVFCVLLGLYIFGKSEGELAMIILSVDGAALLLPHWVTGQRDIMIQPKLLLKLKVLKKLLKQMHEQVEPYQVEYLMLFKGRDDRKIPTDLKFRVNFPEQAPDFLGLYGQVVVNTVKGKRYPYFYVVLVAKQGYGLEEAYQQYRPPDQGFLLFASRNIVKEFQREGDVEVLVLRQKTTRKSGYHTKASAVRRIFEEGLTRAAEVAVPRQAGN